MVMVPRRFFLALFAAASLTSSAASPYTYNSHPHSETSRAPVLAPLYIPHTAAPQDRLNDSYIVIFHPSVPPTAFESHLTFVAHAHAGHPLHGEDSEDEGGGGGGGIAHVYDSEVTKGYAGRFSRDVLEMVRRRPEVKYVELDQVVRLDAVDVQQNPPWGLARLNHRDQLYANNMHYVSASQGGSGVLVYVLDSGVQVSHADFGGRAKWAASFFPDEGDMPVDDIGHGTHVAGIIAGRTYGAAKHTQVRAVKVFSSKKAGTNAIVIAGLQWAVKDAAKHAAEDGAAFRGAVINMSLGSGFSLAVNDATDAAILAGVHIVVAAGNANVDACDFSPASAPHAITVGASTIVDEKAGFSNWGACVDVLAPGQGILSTWIGESDKEFRVQDGTSMAAPYVAGLAAYFLSIYPHATFDPPLDAGLTYPNTPGEGTQKKLGVLTPPQLKRAILDLASRDKIAGFDSETPNLLVFNNVTHQSIVPDSTDALRVGSGLWVQEA